ncbi:MAG TPA: hypothetical protein VGN81_01735 [Pseudonocardiaceae bacterium]
MSTHDEIQLSDDLRHLVAGHSFEADPDALLVRAQRARRRNIATKGAAGIGVLAVAAAGTAIAFNGGSGTPQVQNAAYIAQQVTKALDSDAGNVYRVTDLNEGTVAYLDQVTYNQYFVAGSGDTRVVAWDTFSVVDHQTHLLDTTVNYKDHTYSTDDTNTGLSPSGPPQAGTGIVDRVKQGVKSGSDKIVGTGEYQGHQVIKLTFASGTSGFELWVDSSTYQPVHSIATESDGTKDASDLAFLPRTPDLVHTMTTPQVPAGFAKVDQASNIGHGG